MKYGILCHTTTQKEMVADTIKHGVIMEIYEIIHRYKRKHDSHENFINQRKEHVYIAHYGNKNEI